MYFHRQLENYLKKVDRQFPAILVTGARQVGKTTLLQHQSTSDRTYVSLDDPMVRDLATNDPALFLQRFPAPVLVDEIQYAPELLPHIKIAIDRDRTPGMFWLTGSQQFHLMRGVSESLAGRIGVIPMSGLGYRERIENLGEPSPFIPTPKFIDNRMATSAALGLEKLYFMIWRGAFPAIATNDQMEWDLFYGSYIQTYLQRDLRDLARVGDEMAFLRFLKTAAGRTGQLLNLASIARDADIAPNTAKQWLSILETSGIVYLLQPYANNVTKRLVKQPKLYMLDTGLAAYLSQWTSPQTLEAGAMSGALLETWVVGEIIKSYWHSGKQPPLYFYRDGDQKEIDLLIVQDGTIHPLEIKKTAAPQRRDIKHFSVLNKFKTPIGPGGVVCLCERNLPLNDLHQSIPIGAL